MATITFDRFDGGLDVRQLSTSADANRLRVLKNAYVTTGKTLRKRPGLKRFSTLSAGTNGLFAAFNKLWTFSTTDVAHDHTLLVNKRIDAYSNLSLVDIAQCEIFLNYIYLCAVYTGGVTRHHYLDDATSTLVADANCPHTPTIIKKASKIFAIKDDVVRFSKTSDARTWTAEEDAGFLPVNVQQTGASNPTALGEYQSNLVVFFPDSAQIWYVDPDPELHAFVSTTPIGTRYQNSHANMANDIYFLSPSGFRSIAVQANSSNLMDMDVGSPIDSLMLQVMRGAISPNTVYYRGGGQLMSFIGKKVYVYTFSRAAKISAWAIWDLPITVDAVTELEGVLYLRSGDVVYLFDHNAFDDDGTPIEVDIELPFMDCKQPGVLKQFSAMDVAAEGDYSVAYRFNPRQPEAISNAVSVNGDTRILARVPVELCTTNISPRITHSANAPFELAALSLSYNPLTDFAA